MRLDKLLANMGYGSRKDVKLLVRKGHVSVNDKIIRRNDLHIDVDTDVIYVHNERVQYKQYIYIMLHKPPNYISATEDRYDRTVIDLLPENMRHFKPFPVGRLDKDTEGLLLLTNDGELAHQLTSPKKEIKKVYYAKVNGVVTEEDAQAFARGVVLDDHYKTKPAHLEIVQSAAVSEIKLTITEGKFHQVKRMFQSVDKEVVYLKRIQMGELCLDPQLNLGEYRELNKAEMSYCMSLKS